MEINKQQNYQQSLHSATKTKQIKRLARDLWKQNIEKYAVQCVEQSENE